MIVIRLMLFIRHTKVCGKKIRIESTVQCGYSFNIQHMNKSFVASDLFWYHGIFCEKNIVDKILNRKLESRNDKDS